MQISTKETNNKKLKNKIKIFKGGMLLHTKLKLKIFIAIILLLIIVIPFNFNTTHAKYVIENTFKIATIQLSNNDNSQDNNNNELTKDDLNNNAQNNNNDNDDDKFDDITPKFELIDIQSNNTNYEKYASRIHTLTLQIKLTANNVKTNYFNQNSVKIKVGNDYVTPSYFDFTLLSEYSNEKLYQLMIFGISGNGLLQLEIPSGIVTTNANLQNEASYFHTGITIDNIAPKLTLQKTTQSNFSFLATINSSESIRNIDGWEISNNNTTISKVFNNSASYALPLYDFAQNKSSIFISI